MLFIINVSRHFILDFLGRYDSLLFYFFDGMIIILLIVSLVIQYLNDTYK